MATGLCRMVTESGMTYAIRTDLGNGYLNDLEVDYYEQQGYQPDWRTLDPCGGTGPQKADDK